MVVVTLLDNMLKTCFIGDSGFAIFRKEGEVFETVFEFKEQQHGFNFPFQLAMDKYGGDDPSLSICEDFKVFENDIVIVGSDGLFDNIYVDEMLKLIQQSNG